MPGSARRVTRPATALRPGDLAPVFTLRRTFEENVSLEDVLTRGPVVLAFYVFDFGDA